MFHVKPWADTITFAAVSDTLSSSRVMGSPMSGAMFHVKHDRRPSTRPINGCSAKTTVGPSHSGYGPHPVKQDQSRRPHPNPHHQSLVLLIPPGGGRPTLCPPPTVNRRIRAGYSSSRDVPGASASTRRARSSSPANSMVMRPFFAPRVTFTRVSKASDSRVESAGRGVLRARKTLG